MWNRERWRRIIVAVLFLALFALAIWLGHLYGKRGAAADEPEPQPAPGAELFGRLGVCPGNGTAPSSNVASGGNATQHSRAA
jgi:hypothetical protein